MIKSIKNFIKCNILTSWLFTYGYNVLLLQDVELNYQLDVLPFFFEDWNHFDLTVTSQEYALHMNSSILICFLSVKHFFKDWASGHLAPFVEQQNAGVRREISDSSIYHISQSVLHDFLQVTFHVIEIIFQGSNPSRNGGSTEGRWRYYWSVFTKEGGLFWNYYLNVVYQIFNYFNCACMFWSVPYWLS